MKFTKLSTKFNKLLKKKKKGKSIKPEKLHKIVELLNQKKSRFEEKLKTDVSGEKRSSLESKLRVVNAQIAKSEALLPKEPEEPVNADQSGETAEEDQSGETVKEDQSGETAKEDQSGETVKEDQPGDSVYKDQSGEPLNQP